MESSVGVRSWSVLRGGLLDPEPTHKCHYWLDLRLRRVHVICPKCVTGGSLEVPERHRNPNHPNVAFPLIE